MRSRPLVACVALVVVVLAAAVGVSQATSRAKRGCGSPQSTTTYATGDVRVFTRVVDDFGDRRTVACRRTDGRRFKLAEDQPEFSVESVAHFSVEGTRLGYAVFVNSLTASSGKACALNLETGKRRCAFTLAVHGMGITRAGSIAWLADRDIDGACCDVYKWNAAAKQRVLLDSGADVEPDSFAVGGHRIYWTRGGAVRSARMP